MMMHGGQARLVADIPAPLSGAAAQVNVLVVKEERRIEAMQFINDVIGTSSIRLNQPFERHFRDLHVLMQHSDKSGQRYASAGRLMLGVENDWVWLSF